MSHGGRHARAMLARMLSAIAPPACWACGAGARPQEPLCPACRRSLRRLGPDLVTLAGVPVWAPVSYEGPAQALVRGFKFRGAVGLADPMAAQMVANAPSGLLEPPAVLVPVPLHASRRRKRGYNQAERLAAALARRTGLECRDALRRGGAATRQVGRGRTERLETPPAEVTLAHGALCPADALLVDDVATTGATLGACAAALDAAGARWVMAVTFARTPGR